MRSLTCFCATAICCALIVGCGDPNQPAASNNSTNSGGSSNATRAASGGGGNAASSNTRMIGGQRRNLPTGMLNGGGGAAASTGGGDASSGGAAPADQFVTNQPFTAAPMSENGLFPQLPGAGNASAGLGGALFPVESSTSDVEYTSAASSTESDRPTASINGGGLNNEVTVDGGESVDESLMTQAVASFANHKEQQGMQLLYAHLLSDQEALEKYPIKFYKGLASPSVAMRWGVGIIYDEPPRFDGRHPVIGDTGGAAGAGASASSGPGSAGLEGGGTSPPPGASGNGARPYRQVDSSRPDGFVIYFAGEYGEVFIDYVDKHRRQSRFGDLLGDIPLEKPKVDTAVAAAPTPPPVQTAATRAAKRRRNRRGPASSVAGGGAAGVGGAPGPGAQQNNGGSEFGNGFTAGAGETKTASNAAPKKALARAMGSSDSSDPDPELTGSIVPGVMLIGQGKRSDLIARAKRMNLDILVYFKVKVMKTRSSGRTSSLTGMKILNVRGENEEEIFSGKQLKDTVVADQKSSGRNPVKKIMDSAFKAISEQNFVAAEMPDGLTADYVEKHVNELVSGNVESPLPIAVEIVNFHNMSLLDGEKTTSALDKLFKSDGIGNMLLSHDSSHRLEALKQYVSSGDDDDDEDL